jgi:flagellar basal-body rod protein FlgB
MFPDDLTTDVLAAALRGYDVRNAALANNIANAETPGYRRLDVSFEAALAEAVENDRAALHRDPRLPELPMAPAGHEVGESAPWVRSVDTTVVRADGSNVDPDDEMAQLAANQLAHQTVTSLLDKRLSQFRTAILGR